MHSLTPRTRGKIRFGTIGLFLIMVAACQWHGPGGLIGSRAKVTLQEVRQSLGMTATDVITRSHRIVVMGRFFGPEGEGSFQRSFEPDGSFEHRLQVDGASEQIQRFDGTTLWVDSDEAGPYPMTPARAQVASSVEWTLGARWLLDRDSPFETAIRRARGDREGPRIRLRLQPSNFESQVELDPISFQPSALTLEGRKGPLRLEFEDWRTRRGFPWPFVIRISGESDTPVVLVTDEVYFEPSLVAQKGFDLTVKERGDTRFDRPGTLPAPIRRTRTGHMLVRPTLNGLESGWFLLDTGTGVNCLDPKIVSNADTFLNPNINDDREISIIGLGGTVRGEIHDGGEFALGPMHATGMEWVAIDLSGLEAVVGAPLAGVLGGELFQRAVVEIDLSARTLALYDPTTFDGTRLPWRPLRFDGTTPCVQCKFAPEHEGWFRLDTGSDDTVTFHSPWVRKLSMLKRARNLVPMRLRGIGGEMSAVQGRIPWFELLGLRFTSPRVTLVEQATGPLASQDLVGNLGLGFLTDQRMILDYPHHRVTLIPR